MTRIAAWAGDDLTGADHWKSQIFDLLQIPLILLILSWNLAFLVLLPINVAKIFMKIFILLYKMNVIMFVSVYLAAA